jgi:hypothetical protein
MLSSKEVPGEILFNPLPARNASPREILERMRLCSGCPWANDSVERSRG